MEIESVNNDDVFGINALDFYFTNDVRVAILPDDNIYCYQVGDYEESFINGWFSLEGNTVYDFDGGYAPPKEVIIAFKYLGYKVEL